MALRVRGEAIDEIVGAVHALRAKMVPVSAPPDAIDLVGTGGDGKGSLNISTCAALVVAGAGVTVAKQGGRAQSSRCGAADVLSALGVEIELTPASVSRCIAEAGIGFMFAPRHHPALNHVSPVRIELGTRTLFNLVSPMLNPAKVRRQLVGVYAASWTEPVAQILGELGSDRAMVVHASDGHDEITTAGPTLVASLEEGKVRTFTISPEEVGIPRVAPDALKGSDARSNAAALLQVLQGQRGPYRDIALLNAAAALVVAGRAEGLRHGVALAANSIDSGEARRRLDLLVAVARSCAANEREGTSRA
jgi:anthranilate phosphoribosyltransferase